MLPFPQLVKYGNVRAPEWYTGSDVLMAFDSVNFVPSTGFNTNGFTDYKGKVMTSDAQNTGKLPAKADGTNSILNTFGSYGIILYGSGIVAANSQILPSLTQQDHTVDFWFRNTTTGNANLEMVPFMWYNVMATNNDKWCMWAYMKDGQGPRFTNNNSNTLRTLSLYSTMYNNTNWNHYAYVFVKSTNTISIFLNGIKVDTFTYNIITPAAGSKCGIAGHVNSTDANGGSGAHTAIDRFRIRNTAVWTANFNTSTIYP